MRLLYPLRPLTNSGRVILGFAAAVFAAIALVVWAPSYQDVPAITSAGAPP